MMKKGWKIFWWALLCILVALVVAVMAIWGGEIRTLATVKSVAGNEYLYTMQYRAGYDLDDVIKKDVDTNPELLDYVISRVGKGLPIKIKSSQVSDENGFSRNAEG